MVLKDVCLGMVYLHSAKPPLIHQDIKRYMYFLYYAVFKINKNYAHSLNILLDSSGHGRIGDFGFSWELPDVEGTRSIFTARGFAFSKGYHADEITYGQYSTKSDVYSYGTVRNHWF